MTNMDKKTEKILKRVCFECAISANGPFGGFMSRQKYGKTSLGGQVDIKTCCKECPVAEMRGDGATISTGRPDPIFDKMLAPTEDCAQDIHADETWLPCLCCGNTAKEGDAIRIQDLAFCFEHCPVIEIREAIQEQEAEASCS